MRAAGRFLWHYVEMVIAMALGMLLLGLVWSAFLPEHTRVDVDTLIMAANMTIGMAVWMRVRKHHWRGIAEMSVAMVAPFVVLLVLYWLGVVSGHMVMMLGHVLMFVTMALAMLLRRTEYTQHPVPAKWLKRAAIVLIALLPPTAIAALNTVDKFGARYEARADTVTVRPAPKPHDADKPTVAFVVAEHGANAADLLGPYETLANTGRFNTYVVAPSAEMVPLTGGLDIVPDLTFRSLSRLLDEQQDTLDAVVVPALQNPDHTLTGWLREQSSAGALTVSVCHGARWLAASGLLDGRPATSHWLRLPALRSDFPDVHWKSGYRYVEDGNIITTAGVLSGIDGGLRIIERLIDGDTAREAARMVGWRHYSPGKSARIPESGWAPQDVVVALNASYQPGPSTIGIQLTEGISELDLAAPFISYTEQSMIGHTIAVGPGPIRSKHGLTFVPRATASAVADDLDRLLTPHDTEEFAFDPVLRDIASTYDVQTARFTAKTLEYPVLDVKLTGNAWPWLATLIPIALTLLTAALAVAASIAFRRLRGSAPR